MGCEDMIPITLVSKADHEAMRGASIEVGIYVAPEFLEDAENGKEYLQRRLREARDTKARERVADPSKMTWQEEWYQGPFDMTRQFIEDRPLIRLDW